tara:strand:+ start:95 stop:310 length:216 start_codon:yes stop_codon:yes gene_type:complete
MVCSRKLSTSSGKITSKYGKNNGYKNDYHKPIPYNTDTTDIEDNSYNSVLSGATFSPFENAGTCDLSSSRP